MDRPTPELVNCPHCGLKNPAIEDACASCGKNLELYIGPRPKVKTFRLADGMWWVAAFAICFGVLRVDFGLGCFIGVVLLPALLRTMLSVSERKLDERPMRAGEIATTFFLSFAIMFFTLSASLVVVVITSLLMNQSSPLSGLYVAVVVLAGGITAIAILRKFWPRKD